MKRTALILLISGFWLLVSGYFTNTHAQDDTLTLITYYPAPYGVYNNLQIGSWGIYLSGSDVPLNAGYIRFGNNTGWKLHFGRYQESSGLVAPNTGITGVLMTIQDNGNVGIGTIIPTYKLHVVNPDSRAIHGYSRSSYGVVGESIFGKGVFGTSTSYLGVSGFSEKSNGVHGVSTSSTGVAGYSTSYYGIGGVSTSSYGVYGFSSSHYGVYGYSPTYAGIYGQGNSGIGVRGFSNSSNGVYGSSTKNSGVSGYSTSYYGVYGTSTSSVGVYGYSFPGTGVYGKSDNGVGVHGESNNNHGVVGKGGGAGHYDFYADPDGVDAANFGSFTGAHDVRLNSLIKDIEPGMVVITIGKTETKETYLSSILPIVELASEINDKRVFGVFISEQKLSKEHWYVPKEGERFGIVNSLGEGSVSVTDINGPIKNGDYITTSSIPGYGQRQEDDILHSYTLGKAVEDVDWDKVIDSIEYNGKRHKKVLIAVTYHCG